MPGKSPKDFKRRPFCKEERHHLKCDASVSLSLSVACNHRGNTDCASQKPDVLKFQPETGPLYRLIGVSAQGGRPEGMWTHPSWFHLSWPPLAISSEFSGQPG